MRIQRGLFFGVIMSILLVTMIILANSASSEEVYRFERMWPTLQQPWYFDYPKGIALDNLGYVYVADTLNHRIQKFTSEGQFVATWGSEGSGDGQFDHHYGIATDSRGFVYVADTFNDRIQKFTSEGQFVAKWGSEGSWDGQFKFPHGVATDSSGFVYVADTLNNRIQKFTSEGQFVAKWGSWGTGEGQFNSPGSIAIDSSGFVYVADVNNNRIQKFTSEGQFVAKWGSRGSGDGQFVLPDGLVTDSSGFVYVADTLNNRIQKFTSEGQFVAKWGSSGSGDGQFNNPKGLAIDSRGFIYVTDRHNDHIQKFTSEGQFVAKWGSEGSGDGWFWHPSGIATDSSGFVYVADTWNNRIQKFTSEGQFVTKWGSSGTGEGQFNSPYGIATDSSGFVYVTDFNNNRIQKFTSEGQFVAKWGSEGSGDGQFAYPHGIATDNSGFVYVTDPWNNRIQKFTSEGQFVAKWGSEGTGDGQFNHHDGLAADSSGFIYVADTSNHRIQKFTSEGQFVAKWGSYGSGDGQFDSPEGIAIDSSGCIYVADYGNDCIQQFTSDGEFIAKFGVLGSNPGQLNEPTGICIGTNGLVYVADYANNRIQAFKKIGYDQGLSKAIIVAGGGAYPGNNLWNATQMCANFAYRTLTYQGFTKDTICYLTSNKNLDLDDNGELDDVDFDTTNGNLEQAITEWAADANSVVLYLVDHGGDETFRLSGTEILTSSDLAAWLDTLQTNTDKMTIIYDACEAGSFLSDLTPPSGKERIILTSTSSDEYAHFISQGTVSFSSFFWTHIFNGFTIKEAFDTAKEAIEETIDTQHPWLDDNGDGVSDQEDGAIAQNRYIGTGTLVFDSNAPVIGSVVSEPSGPSSILFTAMDVTDHDGIARVWAIIRPPYDSRGSSHNTVQELPSLELMPVMPIEEGRYEGVYHEFHKQGTYFIAVYGRDRVGNTSIPKVITITIDNPLRRRAVIVAGGPHTGPLWPALETCAKLAYKALSFQGYTDDDIYFMSPEVLEGRDEASNISNLQDALDKYADQNTQDVLVYLVGNGENNNFQINETEYLKDTNFDIWLDALQAHIPGKVTVIYDAPYSGSFLPALIPPAEKERIVITSTGPNEPAFFLCDGAISFSAFFWQQVINGNNMKDAFVYTINAVYTRQTPLLDDNGNGLGNELGKDGRLAKDHTLGFGIMLAGDAPLIGSISPDQAIGNAETATIWVDEVTTTGSIDPNKVWAVIIPPECTGDCLETQETVATIKLNHTGGNRYEGVYDAFSTFGTYRVAVYAVDEEENISLPKETSVTHGPDIYEEDDNFETAKIIVVSDWQPHSHNFHDEGDQDWVKFYGLGGREYEITISDTGSACDAVIELYDTDGNTRLMGPWNWGLENGPDVLMNWNCPQDGDGIYYLMIQNLDPNVFGENTDYDLRVYFPEQPGFTGKIEGFVWDASSKKTIGNAEVTARVEGAVSGGGNFKTPEEDLEEGLEGGWYIIFHPVVACIVTAEATGYITKSHSIQASDFVGVEANKIATVNFDLVPADIDGDGVPDNEDASPSNSYICCDTDGDGCDDCSTGTYDPYDDGPDQDSDGLCDDGDPDDDNDNALDGEDVSPLDRFICCDTDGDGCDDCSTGTYNPNDDGPDYDNDGLCDDGDPDDDNDCLPDDYEINMTKTDPLLLDTDDDGTPDNLEDPDNDGFTNEQEYSRDTHPKIPTHCFWLSAGLNILGCPVEVPDNYTSYNLIENLGTKEEIKKIQKYDPATKTYQTTIYDENGEAGEDEFDIISGEGYLVYMKVGKAVFFDGTITNPSMISLKGGFNFIHFPLVPPDYYSYDLLSYLGTSDEIESIQRFNKETGAFETTTYHYGKPSGSNFKIVNTEAYLIYMKEAKIKDCPW